MKNLIQFLIKHAFIFVFLLLEVISILLIVANNSFQRTAFISASNGFTSGILEASSNVTDYIGLKEKNLQLANENALLRSKLKESFLQGPDSFVTKIDTSLRQFYIYTQAFVITNSVQRRNNYLILNKGRRHGIEPEMGVIASNGVVGIVNEVSEEFCSVISVLHKKSAIDAKISSNGYTGTISWPGGLYTLGNLDNIPSHAELKAGDTLLTSGNSAIFPPNIPIGIIQKFELKKGSSFFSVRFRFLLDFNRLDHVYIIKNMKQEELLKLMGGFEND